MEIQDAGVEIQQSCAEATIDLANRMGLPLVATNDAHYLCQTDAGDARRAAVREHASRTAATKSG